MKSTAGTALAAVFGIWAGASGAGETLWEGEVRVVDAKTLAGAPEGPELPLGGIEPPPPDARCGLAAEGVGCRELAVQALRDATAGQRVVCERDGDGVACRAVGIDIAEWMVRMGWALASGERLREAEGEARAAGQGMWWYEEEGLGQAHDGPSARYLPPPLPGEEVVQACREAGENAFARREYGNLMAIEAADWFIEETRLRWESRHAMEGGGADAAPEALDENTRETLDAAQRLCDLLGGASEESDETEDTSAEDIRIIEDQVERLADRARETCWEAAAGAVRAGRIEDLTGMRQIARHTMLRTGHLSERLWQAREQGDDEEARRALERAHAVFENAEWQCHALAEE